MTTGHVVLEVECLENDLDDIHHTSELLLHLVGTAEDMRIVLREATHTGQAVQLTALLVTVYGTELSETDGEILV